MSAADSHLDAALLDPFDDFDGYPEDRPLFARLLDAVVDADLPGEWGAGTVKAAEA